MAIIYSKDVEINLIVSPVYSKLPKLFCLQ